MSFDRRRRPARGWGRLAAWGIVLAAGATAGLAARGQETINVTRQSPPHVNGLTSRYTAVVPWLPPDRKRDAFQGTRYADEHDCKDGLKLHPRDSALDGGLYGRLMPNCCRAAVAPFFAGQPGSTIGPDCTGHNPVTGRWVVNLFKPFKPVGMYYDRGVYTPIYDLDYFAPGPGPFPWSHFFKRPTGG